MRFLDSTRLLTEAGVLLSDGLAQLLRTMIQVLHFSIVLRLSRSGTRETHGSQPVGTHRA
jgi:hypothetical protein